MEDLDLVLELELGLELEHLAEDCQLHLQQLGDQDQLVVVVVVIGQADQDQLVVVVGQADQDQLVVVVVVVLGQAEPDQLLDDDVLKVLDHLQ